MSKDNIGCTIAAVIMLSVIGMGLYLVNLQDREDEEREKEAKEMEAKSTGLDEYVIVDRMRCAHTRGCFQLMYNDSLMYAVKYIDTLTITEDDYEYVCVNCIGNKEYKNLKRITYRNKNGEKPKKKIPGWD